ncbi:hypothetical protein GCK72_022979 [Caenorhabditis remanei]|uniref:Uncharacterized protein n=1 Tax=Caenorhabditis remanei TaxID=31234 RepID=A0A6A5FVF3_CAERE|nr:hypothetical protein GCK72_022979 [Caenorhabditis remanei]KAF1746523.1 hypothetical protein GCK72_022979 [Caenorhabditis remanei]
MKLIILLSVMIPLVASKVCKPRTTSVHPVYQMKVGGRYRFEDGVFVWKTCNQIPEFIQKIDGVWYANPKNENIGTYCLQYRLQKYLNPHLVDVKVVDRMRISEGSESETLPAKTTVMKDISRKLYNSMETRKLFYAKASPETTIVKWTDANVTAVPVTPHDTKTSTMFPKMSVEQEEMTSTPANSRISKETALEQELSGIFPNTLQQLTVVVVFLIVLCGIFLKMWLRLRRAV